MTADLKLAAVAVATAIELIEAAESRSSRHTAWAWALTPIILR